MMSPTTPTALASGVVRLLPLPRPSRVTSVQGSLALGPVARVDPPAAPRVQARPGCDVISVDPEIRSQLEQWTGRILQAAADIVSGDRPVSQLVRWTTAEVHDDLSRRARLIAAAAGHQAGCGRGSAPWSAHNWWPSPPASSAAMPSR